MFKKLIATLVFTAMLSTGFTTMGDIDQAAAASHHTKAIAVAKTNLGIKYKWGGTTKKGFDCSGLVNTSFAKAGKKLPRTAAEMYKTGKKVNKNALKTGDLLFYNTGSKKGKVTHVSIYIGNGKMIHSSSSKGVSIISTNDSYWKKRYIGAKRI